MPLRKAPQVTGAGASLVPCPAALDLSQALAAWVMMLVVTHEVGAAASSRRTNVRWSPWCTCASMAPSPGSPPASASRRAQATLPDPWAGTLAGGLRRDAASAEGPLVLVVVVAVVGEQPPWSVTWPAHQATDAGYRVQQGHRLGDVMTVSAGQRHRKRGVPYRPVSMVPAAPAAAADRRRRPV